MEALPTEYFQRVWDIFLSEGACGSRLFLYSRTQLSCSRSYFRYGVSHPSLPVLLSHFLQPTLVFLAVPGKRFTLPSNICAFNSKCRDTKSIHTERQAKYMFYSVHTRARSDLLVRLKGEQVGHSLDRTK